MAEEFNQAKITEWYKNKLIHYNLFPILKNRTVDFITPRAIAKEKEIKRSAFRYINIKSFTGLNFNIEKGEVVEMFRNIYYSVATLSDSFEGISIADRLQEKEARAEINANFEKYVTGYDLVIDIDNPDLKQAHKEAISIKTILDNFGVPYSVIFSGNKGFNFRVQTQYIPENIKPLDRPEYFLKVIENLKLKENLGSVDLEVYTIGRVFKLPYSIERHHDYVALPLTDYQLENFNVEEMTLDNVKKNVKLMNRGVLTRAGTKEGVSDFLKNYEPKFSLLGKIKKAWGEAKNE